ncbi:hypothetical protein C7M84_009465 [Penaeus vannamei]|uniref:Uncharacterized protein n=1 Tax=Penaeus vannamei TaxID=6689 RepID=A0A423T6N3_PENVA|nr:hypothetical protein C7M84_009465 [Penaeus vannamei]
MLRTSLASSGSEWDLWIPIIQMAINNTFHSTLGDTPHFVVYGEDRRLPYELLDQSPRPTYTDDYASRIIRKKQEIYCIAKRHLQFERDRIIRQQHKLSRRKDIATGALVFHSASERSAPMPKLSPRFDGPYRVLQVRHNKALCRSLLTSSQSWFHFDTLKLASKHYEDEFFRINPRDHDVILRSLDHTSLSFISSSALSSCSSVLSRFHACFDVFPPEHSYFHSSCHKALLSNGDVQSSCLFNQLNSTNPFLLTLPDLHLLYFFSATHVSISCGSNHADREVSAAFLLPRSCQLSARLISLRSSHSFHFAYSPTTPTLPPMSLDLPVTNVSLPLANVRKLPSYRDNTPDILTFAHSPHVTFGFPVFSTVIGLVIAIFGFLLYRHLTIRRLRIVSSASSYTLYLSSHPILVVAETVLLARHVGGTHRQHPALLLISLPLSRSRFHQDVTDVNSARYSGAPGGIRPTKLYGPSPCLRRLITNNHRQAPEQEPKEEIQARTRAEGRNSSKTVDTGRKQTRGNQQTPCRVTSTHKYATHTTPVPNRAEGWESSEVALTKEFRPADDAPPLGPHRRRTPRNLQTKPKKTEFTLPVPALPSDPPLRKRAPPLISHLKLHSSLCLTQSPRSTENEHSLLHSHPRGPPLMIHNICTV